MGERPASLWNSASSLFQNERKISERSRIDRKSTRLNSSHQIISYAVFCLKKKKQFDRPDQLRRVQGGRYGDAIRLGRRAPALRHPYERAVADGPYRHDAGDVQQRSTTSRP